MAHKPRLDEHLVELGLAESRREARALIGAGEVEVDGQRQVTAGMRISDEADVRRRDRPRWVGRGGAKLHAAFPRFRLDVAGRACLDVGASTGGFTDVLLHHGARHVYAVDVGRAQLAWRLRQDERVTCLERTDIRQLESLPEPIDMATVDVSFISLERVLPHVARHVQPRAPILCLVKPQFEAARDQVGRGGVVRDPTVHRAVLQQLLDWSRSHGFVPRNAMPSPIRGRQGNLEVLLLMETPAVTEDEGAPRAAAPSNAQLIERALSETHGESASGNEGTTSG